MIVAIGILSFLLMACSSNENNASNALEVGDIKELVYNFSSGNLFSPTVQASATQLLVTNADQSTEIYNFPKDEFYVAIAPFINQTHH